MVTRHLQQVRPNCVEAVVGGQRLLETREQPQSRRRTIDHGQGDRAVERHHRVAGHPL